MSWHSKKHNSISLSTAKAEYIVARSYCTQLLWMKQMFANYSMVQDTLTVFCDNTSVINISKNPVQHSWTKHIDIRHHFIIDSANHKPLITFHFRSWKPFACALQLAIGKIISFNYSIVLNWINCFDFFHSIPSGCIFFLPI